MDSILSGLNAAQRAAVTSPVDVLQILAPPGSGKTKTLTARVAYLLHDCHYEPWNIICLTFTIKSSLEMKERISTLIDHRIARKLILGTFHSVCRRYLVAYGHLIGIRKDFGIADSSDQTSIIKRIHKRLHLTVDLKAAQTRISQSKSKGLTYHDLAHELQKKRNVEQQEIVTLFEAYEAHLAISNLLDYDDLLLRCVNLLRTHPSCVSNIEVVLVDEFQDTNVVQYDLLKLFAAHRTRLTTVGDPDQSIYGWRSAEIKNLKKMQKQYPDTLVIRLEDNYRSSGAILLAAQEVIEQDQSRPQKTIVPTHCPGTMPVLRKLPSASIEAEWTVKEIQRIMALTGRLLEYSDFAILLRSAYLSRLLESAMGKAGIPYRMVGGQRFFDRIEVKLLLDYLRVVSQPDNNDALVRIINNPARGIGPVTVKSLLEEAESCKETLWTLIRSALMGHKITKTKISKAAEQGLSDMTGIVITTRSKMLDLNNPQTPERLLRLIIRKLDFQSYLKRSYREDHDSRWANVEELVAQASEYCVSSPESTPDEKGDDSLPQINNLAQEKSHGAAETLSKFLANVALAAAVDLVKDDDIESGKSLPRVTISTIHAAKGLEWPVVFVPSVYEGSIPHSRAEDTDEERRLLYVAMTRAQSLLYMSCPVKNSQGEETELSAFLSTKNVNRLLSNQGPIINVPAVVDIARILRRVCPAGKTIEEQSQDLQSFYDDLWPLMGERSTEIMQKQWTKSGGGEVLTQDKQAFKKRRRLGEESNSKSSYIVSKSTTFVGNLTTMDNSASFSYRGTIGFSSAAAQLQLTEESNYKRDKSDTGAEKPQKRRKKDASLVTMLGNRKITDEKIQNKETPAVVHGEDARTWSKKASSNVAREPGQRIPLTTIPPELAAHRLKPLVKKAKTPQYILLSSSPPRPEDQGEKPPSEITCSTGKAAPISKPASVPQSSNISYLQSTSDSSRKGLGVRRNMGGWQSRPNKGFKVPTMTPKQT